MKLRRSVTSRRSGLCKWTAFVAGQQTRERADCSPHPEAALCNTGQAYEKIAAPQNCKGPDETYGRTAKWPRAIRLRSSQHHNGNADSDKRKQRSGIGKFSNLRDRKQACDNGHNAAGHGGDHMGGLKTSVHAAENFG